MNITKEYLTKLIKEELQKIVEKNVRELDVIPGSTQSSHKIGNNNKIVLSKRVNTSNNKVTYIVALINGTGKDESLTNYRKEFKSEKEAKQFYDSLVKINNLKQIIKSFKDKQEKTKEGKDES
jgi:GTPase Era involved in 16S rRNA processing